VLSNRFLDTGTSISLPSVVVNSRSREKDGLGLLLAYFDRDPFMRSMAPKRLESSSEVVATPQVSASVETSTLLYVAARKLLRLRRMGSTQRLRFSCSESELKLSRSFRWSDAPSTLSSAGGSDSTALSVGSTSVVNEMSPSAWSKSERHSWSCS